MDTKRARFHPLRDIYAPRFMTHEVNVLVALYYASSHLSRLKDNSPSLEVAQIESAICRSLITRISSMQQQADDFSIMAVLGMIAVEVEIWSRASSWPTVFTLANPCRTIRR
jgi:hypothetical protein